MDYPFGGGGHHHHHHHHRPEEEQNPNPNPYPPPAQDPYGYRPPPPQPHDPYGYRPSPPQPFYGGAPTGDYPPPAVQHVSHEYGRPAYPAPPGNEYGYGRPEYSHPPPPPVGHEVGGQRPWFSPSPNPHVEHHSHEGSLGELLRQRSVRIYCKAAENYSLSIRDGNVVLVPANHRDEYQHWIKDMKYSTRVKDQEGLPSFALVNKATGQAIKHAIGGTHPVRLVRYNPDYLDESVLWTESHDTGEGFRCIRMVNNIGLNFDAFNGDEDHGGVRDGTKIVLWEWAKGKNQRWKVVPY